jgi:hypothetical protein
MQAIVFFTVPPDMFYDLSQADLAAAGTGMRIGRGQRRESRDPRLWRPEESYHAIDIFNHPFQDSTAYPPEICGQVVGFGSNLVELALDSSPEMVIWAFSAEGWAKTFALDTGGSQPSVTTAVQQDGSLRNIDFEGDVGMADREDVTSPELATDLGPFDGPSLQWPAQSDNSGRMMAGFEADRMSGTVSVELSEEASGISRVDVELR